MNIDQTFTDLLNNAYLLLIFKYGLLTVISLLTTLMSLYAFLVVRKIQILNAIIKTPFGLMLTIIATLFLSLCVGTLVFIITIWTNQ